ncbi:hypothetical protein ABPG77_002731 [Micractinium sp. CCAP 211/92]
MHFSRQPWEQRFQLSFNRGCMRTDILYALCLAAFGLSAFYRVRQEPSATGGTALAAPPLLACVPLLLLLTAVWPAQYVRHRQPIVAALKVWAAFVGSLLPNHFTGTLGAAISGCTGGSASAGTQTLRAGVGLTAQLALHALGLQTTGAWLVFSQGFVVAASARTATLCCACHLAPATRELLSTRPAAAALLRGTDPGLLCEAYALGLQILVGYAATTAVGLFAEWRQRKAFAAKHQLPPPSHMDLFALNGAFLSMLFFLWRVALAEAVRLPATSCSLAAAGAGACPAAL